MLSLKSLTKKEIFALLRVTDNSKLKKQLRFELSKRNNNPNFTSKQRKSNGYTVCYGIDKNMVDTWNIKSNEELLEFEQEWFEFMKDKGVAYCHYTLQPCGVAYVIVYDDSYED